METGSYTHLGRQAGLLREMQAVANNIANMSTDGYRSERVLFSEFVVDRGEGAYSASMGNANVRHSNFSQGSLKSTGSSLDLAIEGDGFFQLLTDQGNVLSRQSSFSLSPEGIIVDQTGSALLDEGGSPITLPQGSNQPSIGPDGTVSLNGNAVAKVGVWNVESEGSLTRKDGVHFSFTGTLDPSEASINQGFIEQSNVDPVNQISRMIEIQRSYELTQSLMDRDDERIRSTIREIGK